MDHDEDSSEWGTNGFYPLPGLRGGSVHHCNDEVGPGAGEMMMMMGGGHGGGRDSVSSQLDLIDSALPSDSDHAYDHHSSEEELEVINSTSYDEVDDEVNLPDGDDLLLVDGEGDEQGDCSRRAVENCTKRKWSQMAANRLSVESTSSSDDEVQGLLRPLSTPVEFRTSPPVDAHKPSRTQSPPPKLFLFSGSGPSPPLVSSSTTAPSCLSVGVAGGLCYSNGVGEEGAAALIVAPEGSAGASSPISSNVVSSSILTSSVVVPPGALTMIMSGRSTGVFRGIRRFAQFNQSQDNPYNTNSLSSSTSSSSSLNNAPVLAGTTKAQDNDSAGTIANSTTTSTTTNVTEESGERGRRELEEEGGFGDGLGSGSRSHHQTSTITTTTTTSTNNHETPTNTNTPNSTTISTTNNSPSFNLNTSSTTTNSSIGAFGKVTSSRNRSGSGGSGSNARDSSSRKRHRHHNPRHIQRPWLDFEKMQQVRRNRENFPYFSFCPTFSGKSSTRLSL
jgi:hypothetical protein